MKQKPNSRRKRKSIKPMELTPILRQFLVADGASGQISNELRFFLSHFLLRLTSQDLRREAELLRPETKNQLEKNNASRLQLFSRCGKKIGRNNRRY